MPPQPLFSTSTRLKAALEEARARAAKDLGVTPKRLLSDAALEAVLEARPVTELGLRGVKGVGLRAAAALAKDVARLFGSQTVVLEDEEPRIETEREAPLPETPGTSQEPGPVEVAVPVSAYLRTLNEALGACGAIVRGEVTEAREYPRGIYFSIKDATGKEGILNCYLPPYRVRLFAHLIARGTELRVAGMPRIAARKGGFSFQVEAVEAVGEGTLRAAYEALRRRLDEEGLFGRSLPVPAGVRRIGIVTSSAGAVIGDFRRNLDDRGYRLTMHDARVEGVRAVPSILAALAWFKEHESEFDVIVIMRGGGSLEDLQAFNSEPVARAVAGIGIPVIAAIGHDRDVPIANLAADRSTSTPSIAATLINQSWNAADAALAFGTERIRAGGQATVHRLERRIGFAAERLAGRSGILVARARERLARSADRLQAQVVQYSRLPDELLARLVSGFDVQREALRERLLVVERELAIVDPRRTLRLGYSILTGAGGKAVRSVRDLAPGAEVRARLADGTARATITELEHDHPEG